MGGELSIAEFTRQLDVTPLPQRAHILDHARSALMLQRAVIETELSDMRDRGLSSTHTKVKSAGLALSAVNAELSIVGKMSKATNESLNSARWKDAIYNLYGEDAVSACREWVIAKQAESENNRIPDELMPYMELYGLSENNAGKT